MQGERSDGNGQESWQRLDEFRRRPDNLTTEERREALDRLDAEVAANPNNAYGPLLDLMPMVGNSFTHQ